MVVAVVVIDKEEEEQEMVEVVVVEVAHHRCLHKDMIHTWFQCMLVEETLVGLTS